MKQPFSPNINHAVFKNTIYRIQENEGNSYRIDIIRDLLAKVDNRNFYDGFITLCAEWNVSVVSYKETVNGIDTYKVELRFNGYDYSSVTYADAAKDITEDLARNLYRLLGTQINNEQYLNNQS